MNVLLMAAVYGILSSGKFVQAPYISTCDMVAMPTHALTEEQANGIGYRLLVDEKPICHSNEYSVAVGYEYRDVVPEGQTNTIGRIYRTYETAVPQPVPRRWTPRSIINTSMAQGKWERLKEFLVDSGAYDLFIGASYEDESDPDFIRLIALARTRFGDAFIDGILSEAETE